MVQVQCLAMIYTGPDHLSLKVQNMEFDFDVSVCYCMLSTDTSKLNLRPNNSVQMSIGGLVQIGAGSLNLRIKT